MSAKKYRIMNDVAKIFIKEKNITFEMELLNLREFLYLMDGQVVHSDLFYLVINLTLDRRMCPHKFFSLKSKG